MISLRRKNSYEIKKMSDQEKREYFLESKKYYGNLANQLKYYKLNELIHPFLLFIVNTFTKSRLKNIYELNDKPIINSSSKIYISNHSNANDFIVLSKIIKEHFFILADYTMINDSFVNSLNKLNGCIYVDRDSKISGQNAFKQSVDAINKNYNILLFPECTWSLLPGQPILPRKWGDIKLAKETGKPIVPIILDYNSENCFIKYCNPIYVGKNDDIKKMDKYIQNLMQNAKDEIRKSKIYLENSKDIDYTKWLTETIKSYKYFDVEYETSLIRKNDDYYKDEFKYILDTGEKIHPKEKINKRLNKSKINYRIK